MAGGGGGATIEYTPTWVVSLVCGVIVAISLAVEHLLHSLGTLLKKKKQKPLFEALQKIKEELMLLGFISLMLTVCQGSITKICIPKYLSTTWLPCKKEKVKRVHGIFNPDNLDSLLDSSISFRHHFGRSLAGGSDPDYCKKQGKAPLLSETALHHLHIFIFVLAVCHVTFCCLTALFGGAKIRKWKRWEEAALTELQEAEPVFKRETTYVREHAFVKNRIRGDGKVDEAAGWFYAFFKQFRGSLNKTDYTTLRLGFVMTHCSSYPQFDFHSYVTRAFEADFKKVVGISWHLWLFVVFFLLINVHGLQAYFWLAFIPLFGLLAVGTKLQHILIELAQDVVSKQRSVEGDLIVKPSDEYFWFQKPKLVLLLIHMILFQNSFEIAVLLWISLQYGLHSCIMGHVGFIIPRLIIGFFVQFLCSYSVLPLYAIVAQMGTSFKKSIFREHVQLSLIHWAKQARRNVERNNHGSRSTRSWGSLSSIGSMSMRYASYSMRNASFKPSFSIRQPSKSSSKKPENTSGPL